MDNRKPNLNCFVNLKKFKMDDNNAAYNPLVMFQSSSLIYQPNMKQIKPLILEGH